MITFCAQMLHKRSLQNNAGPLGMPEWPASSSDQHHHLDMIQQRVTPVQTVSLVVHGEAVGPAQGRVPEHLDVGPVHVGPGDVGGSVPLTEEHVASVGMDNNGPGPLEVLEKRPSVLVILGREDIEGALPRVDVVEVVAGPVHGEPLHPLVLAGQDILPRGSIFLHLEMEIK